MLFCAAADVSSSTRLSEGDDAESSETASVEGPGKAATSINWMHVRCPSLCLISTTHAPGPVVDDLELSHSLQKEIPLQEVWALPGLTLNSCLFKSRTTLGVCWRGMGQSQAQMQDISSSGGPTSVVTSFIVKEGLVGQSSCDSGAQHVRICGEPFL